MQKYRGILKILELRSSGIVYPINARRKKQFSPKEIKRKKIDNSDRPTDNA